MLSSNTHRRIDKKTEDRMKWHLFIGGAICPTALLTLFSSMYRCWMFDDEYSKIEYTEYYIFGIRVARRRL